MASGCSISTCRRSKQADLIYNWSASPVFGLLASMKKYTHQGLNHLSTLQQTHTNLRKLSKWKLKSSRLWISTWFFQPLTILLKSLEWLEKAEVLPFISPNCQHSKDYHSNSSKQQLHWLHYPSVTTSSRLKPKQKSLLAWWIPMKWWNASSKCANCCQNPTNTVSRQSLVNFLQLSGTTLPKFNWKPIANSDCLINYHSSYSIWVPMTNSLSSTSNIQTPWSLLVSKYEDRFGHIESYMFLDILWCYFFD